MQFFPASNDLGIVGSRSGKQVWPELPPDTKELLWLGEDEGKERNKCYKQYWKLTTKQDQVNVLCRRRDETETGRF